jgi:hypothetical protein
VAYVLAYSNTSQYLHLRPRRPRLIISMSASSFITYSNTDTSIFAYLLTLIGGVIANGNTGRSPAGYESAQANICRIINKIYGTLQCISRLTNHEDTILRRTGHQHISIAISIRQSTSSLYGRESHSTSTHKTHRPSISVHSSNISRRKNHH